MAGFAIIVKVNIVEGFNVSNVINGRPDDELTLAIERPFIIATGSVLPQHAITATCCLYLNGAPPGDGIRPHCHAVFRDFRAAVDQVHALR